MWVFYVLYGLCKTAYSSRLLEDLALLVETWSVATEVTIPSEVIFDQLPVLLVLVVYLLPLVAAEVGGFLHFIGDLRSTEEPNRSDLHFGFFAKDQKGTEAVLPQLVKALYPTTDQVVRHE